MLVSSLSLFKRKHLRLVRSLSVDLQNFSSATCLVGTLQTGMAKMMYCLIGLVNSAEMCFFTKKEVTGNGKKIGPIGFCYPTDGV